ncbi:MAG: TonB-dependent receptor, partial [Pseudomonadota bacterium]
MKKTALLASVSILSSIVIPGLATVSHAADEILVSATRRAESIQEVPVSVVSLTGDTLDKVGIYNEAELTTYVPNFEFASNSIQTNLYIRGIGSGPTHAIEQSVGRFVDDLYTGRADMSILGFMDVASVEVLRGPQGTLFGKNTIAGAIVINTGAPTNELEGGVSATYGDWSTVNSYQEVQGYISGPLSENVRGRIALKWRDDGGFVENVLPGPDSSDRRDLQGRIRLDFDLSDRTVVQLKGEFHDLEVNGQPLNEQAQPSPAPGRNDIFEAALGPGVLGLNWRNGINCEVEPIVDLGGGELVNTGQFCPFKNQDTYAASMIVDHEFPGVGTLRSITGYQSYDWDEQFISVDNGILGGTFRAERAEKYEALTQELRFTSEEFESFDYIIGAYFEDSSIDRFQRSNFNFRTLTGGGPFQTRNQPWGQNTQTFAIYGQGSYQVTSDLEVTVGARWSRDRKDYRFSQFWNEYRTQTPLAGPPTFELTPDEESWSNFSPSVHVGYDVTDDVLLFASVSRGFKSGGFSDRVESEDSDLVYDPETNTNYEIGMKSTFADGAVTLNLTGFYMDFTDQQVAAIVPGSAGDFTVTNAATSTSKGVEAELLWDVTDAVQLGGNWAYTDATFDEFDGPCSAAPAPGQVNMDGSCSYSGFALPYAPKSKGSVFVDYLAEDLAGGWDVNLRGTASFSSSFFVNSTYEPGEFQGSYQKFDATIRLVSPNDRYSVSLIGR